jgi:hypothetical protein
MCPPTNSMPNIVFENFVRTFSVLTWKVKINRFCFHHSHFFPSFVVCLQISKINKVCGVYDWNPSFTLYRKTVRRKNRWLLREKVTRMESEKNILSKKKQQKQKTTECRNSQNISLILYFIKLTPKSLWHSNKSTLLCVNERQ